MQEKGRVGRPGRPGADGDRGAPGAPGFDALEPYDGIPGPKGQQGRDGGKYYPTELYTVFIQVCIAALPPTPIYQTHINTYYLNY